jgi:hypothetical protein
MRLHTAFLFVGVLAFSASATDEEGGYTVLGFGRESCSQPLAVNGEWLAGLERITCDLDDALLWTLNYYGADPAGNLIARSQHKGSLRR